VTRLLLCTATILALTESASAQGPFTKEELNDKEANAKWNKNGVRIKEFTRYVSSGKNLKLDFLVVLNPNCSLVDEFDVKVLKHPEHGTVELVPSDGFPAFAKDNERFKCTTKKVRGINVIYKSPAGYAGPDDLHIISFLANGYAIEVHYRLNVMR
jgi:hypothetical protein